MRSSGPFSVLRPKVVYKERDSVQSRVTAAWVSGFLIAVVYCVRMEPWDHAERAVGGSLMSSRGEEQWGEFSAKVRHLLEDVLVQFGHSAIMF